MNAMDFEDLLYKTVLIMREDERVRAEINDRFRYISVDEYQDVSFLDAELIKLLAGERKNLLAIGDPRQCVVEGTVIETPDGPKPVQSIRQGDIINCAIGCGAIGTSAVTEVFSREVRDSVVVIRTAGGRTLRTTPEHTHFAGFPTDQDDQLYFVYLMYKEGLGYRVGVTSKRAEPRPGGYARYKSRLTQEQADALWLLDSFTEKSEAVYWEAYYSVRFGLPTWRFHDAGVTYSQVLIDRLFNSIDTRARAEELLQSRGMSMNHPHHRPKCMSKRRRRNFSIIMCAEGRLHRYAISGSDEADGERLAALGLKIRPSKHSRGWRIESSVRNLAAVYRLADIVRAALRELNVIEKAHFGEHTLPMIPAAHILPGMLVFVSEDGMVTEDTVIDVRYEMYEGTVYDLNVERYHNFIADGVVTHNCIFGFRGSDMHFLMDFQKEYNARLFVLNTNYRSGARIVSDAERLVSNNELRPDYTCTPARGGGSVLMREFDFSRAEARFVAAEIERLVAQGTSYGDMAVLYRVNALRLSLEPVFIEQQIPYTIVNGVQFADRRSVQDVACYLRLLINPDDNMAATRAMAVPSWGIGEGTLGTLSELADSRAVSLYAVISNPHWLSVSPRASRSIEAFRAALSKIQQSYTSGATVSDLVDAIVALGFEEHYQRKDRKHVEGHLEAIHALQDHALRYPGPAEDTLVEFVEDLALGAEVDKGDPKGVKLMTVHAAKGLEFKAVFLIGCDEGLFPHYFSMGSPEGIEEERRLMYVAMTRAIDHLYVTSAFSRILHGRMRDAMPSPFLREIN